MDGTKLCGTVKILAKVWKFIIFKHQRKFKILSGFGCYSPVGNPDVPHPRAAQLERSGWKYLKIRNSGQSGSL